MTTAKRKTATKPAHVKPLTSARWSGVRLSNTTEKKLSDAYAKRRTAKRKPAAKKTVKEGPSLSKDSKHIVAISYNKRKIHKRNSKELHYLSKEKLMRWGLKYANRAKAGRPKLIGAHGRAESFLLQMYAPYCSRATIRFDWNSIKQSWTAYGDVWVFYQDMSKKLGTHLSPVSLDNTRSIEGYIKNVGKELDKANEIAKGYIRDGYLTISGNVTDVKGNPLKRLG